MQDTDTIHILYCGDCGYVPMIGVSMTSVVWNHLHSRLAFHLLLDHITEADMEKLKRFYALYRNVEAISVQFVPESSREMKVFRAVHSDYPVSVNYRLLAPQLLDVQVDKILYLDGDVICRKSLERLWQQDIGQNLAAAVVDPMEASHIKRIGGGAYFNSGVLLMNLKLWRQENIIEKMLDVYRRYEGQEWWFPDQDALNEVCVNRILRLPQWYNYPVSCNFTIKGRRNDIAEEAVLAHFLGPVTKPWHISCLDCRSVLWSAYKERSFWSDMPLQGDAAMKDEMKVIQRLFEDGRGDEGYAAYQAFYKKRGCKWPVSVFL